MPLEKLRVLSVLVIASVTSSLIAGEFHLFQFLIYVGITVPLWFDIDLDKVRELPYWRILIFLGFVLFVGCRIIGIQFRNTLFFLILCCIIYEFYGEKRPKAPVRLISLLSFLFMLSQVRQNYGLSLLLSITVYMVAVVWCLINFHSGGLHLKDYGIAFQKRLPRAVVHTFFIALLGMGVFWLFPRLPDQSMTVIGNLSGTRLSGFSDEVSLNDIGTLKLSRKHIMDLTPLDGKLHSNYLKGKVLDLYQNGTWTTVFTQSHFIKASEDDMFTIEETSPVRDRIRYRLDIEPLQNNTIFFFNDVVQFQGRLKNLKISGRISATRMNQVQVFKFYPSAMSYTLYCAPEGSFTDTRRGMRYYLQLPEELDYFRPLARQLVSDANATTQIEKIRTFRDFFLNEFTYTLEINNQEAGDPLRDFVAVQKQGHCELFASSMVMLLRAEGIPARLVTGFLVPEKHPAGDFHSITEADAHAWVEVLQDGRWVTVDPTPPANFVRNSFMQTQLSYFNYLWRTKIILWDADSQSAMFAKVFGVMRALFAWFLKDGWRFLIILVLALSALLGWSLWRETRKSAYLSRIFLKLDQRLQKHFGQRPTQLPWRDWLQNLNLDKPLKQDLVGWVNAYHMVRFGKNAVDKTASEPLLREGRQLHNRLKRSSIG